MSVFDFTRKYQQLKVQKNSGFDKSHKNLLTTMPGTITPILVDELIPGTKVHLDVAIDASCAPLAVQSFANVYIECNAFCIPLRLLYGGFEDWVTNGLRINAQGQEQPVTIPVLQITSAHSAYLKSGSLADYLGLKPDVANYGSVSSWATSKWNIFPFLAYHRIYDDWFRNTLVQRQIFTKPTPNASNLVQFLPFICQTGTTEAPYSVNSSLPGNFTLADLHQRNFDLDYFSSALPNPQMGSAQTVSMNVTVDSQGNSGTSFTIASLRASNSLQQFCERNAFSRGRLVDWVRANYGANLSDGLAQRSLWLGRQVFSVYTKGVEQTAPSTQDSDLSTNPFGNVGATYGRVFCQGKGNLVENFTCNEPAILMVVATIVPKVTYGSGCRRYLRHFNAHNSVTDIANAALQNVGNQPIFQGELNSYKFLSNVANVFGYTDRYAEYMTMEDELHGQVRDGQPLASFALQRNFTSGTTPTISSDFLTIPTTYLDQIYAGGVGVTNYGAWMDCYFNYKVSQPLAQYSIPSLQDPAYEHGKSVKVKKGGSSVY